MEPYIPRQLAGVRIERANTTGAVGTQEPDLFPDNGGNIPGKKIEPMVCTAAKIAYPYSLPKK
jgi:hypothetical protein